MEVLKGIELMRGIEVFIVFTMASLNLAVVPGRKGLYELMTNTEFPQCSFKQCFFIGSLGVQTIGKLETVVRLNTLDGIRKALHTMLVLLTSKILFAHFAVDGVELPLYG